MGKPTDMTFSVTYDAERDGTNYVTMTFGNVSIRMDEAACEDLISDIGFAIKRGYEIHCENIVDPGGGSALRGKFEYGNLYSHRELIEAEITILPTPSPAQAAE